MSVRKLTLGLMAILAITCGLRQASAQHGQHVPFADPLAFDPDFRWFEPVTGQDLMDMRPSKRASTGWFGTLDRMNLYVTRPENVPSYYQLDDGWGGRGEIGFMTEDDHGWLATLSYIDGPNAHNVVRTERINRLNPDDLVTSDDDPEFTDLRGQLVPMADRNTPGFSERVYFPGESLNIMEMDTFELNKTFRLEPYHYGGILEPMIGFRYMQIEDTYFRAQYRSTEAITYPPLISLTDDPTEQLITDLSRADNQMFGGQVGFRYFKFYDRFMLSTDLRVFAMQNFQHNEDRTIINTTVYEDDSLGAETEIYESTETARVVARNDEFAFGFDLRSELAYTITRDFSIRGGLQIYDVAQGVWRGRINDANDQAVFMVGYTFGMTINR
ncbi:BBP7 family outer membrane beta-barrel protein [Roseimaritima sediminicola]|uniref:BBP7 family outer membrane beta-barrel protein n=1 Tax=Roseimaritima sediminicola TaxID=2662066 RepID=UPI00129846F5|nr:BBP7 family outer membrane beta-barrel protein [Roseimaritima sediminicola]